MFAVRLLEESACRSDILERVLFRNMAQQWKLKAHIVPKWGLVAQICATSGPIDVARRDGARYDSPGPPRPRDADFSRLSKNVPH